MNEISDSAQVDVKLTRVFSRTPSSWDPQDDLLLRHLKEEQKLGWKEIASHFAHRTPNACQFRWRRLRSGSLKSNGTNEKEKDKNDSSSTSTPINSLTKNSISPSTSPDPMASSSYSKFQSIPSQIKSSSSPIMKNVKNLEIDYNNQFTFNSKQKISNSAVKKSTKRRNSSKIGPNEEVFHYSSTSSISSDDEDLNKNKWTSDEDELILTRKQRQLSFAELSILLQRRSETEINERISQLEKHSKNSSIDYLSPKKSSTSKIQQRINTIKKSSRSLSSSYSAKPISIHNDLVIHHSLPRSKSRSKSFSTRSKSFSLVTPPYFTTAPSNFQERYYSQRKNSISNNKSNILLPNDRKNSIVGGNLNNHFIGSNLIKPRSNSMKYSASLDSASISVNEAIDDSFGYSSDEEEFVSYNTSNIRVEPLIRSGVPNLGSLLNEA